MIRVFISHKREDSTIAVEISARLRAREGIQTYVDVLDPHIQGPSPDLDEYLRTMLGTCTHLMAVISRRTILSWWVPFEIGMATEKEYPISTFLADEASLPDYLLRWPNLTRLEELAYFAVVAVRDVQGLLQRDLRKAATYERRQYSQAFHADLKMLLGQ